MHLESGILVDGVVKVVVDMYMFSIERRGIRS